MKKDNIFFHVEFNWWSDIQLAVFHLLENLLTAFIVREIPQIILSFFIIIIILENSYYLLNCILSYTSRIAEA